jgi:cob(I)alamin adenosyltransferase
MKIYTRKGDDGLTGLLGPGRVSKASLRIECIGTVDELNSFIGFAEVVAPAEIKPLLQQVQNELFNIGAHLAAPDPKAVEELLPKLPESIIERLEHEIDDAEKRTGPLRSFIQPGGSESSARLHLARAVCRRAERCLVALVAESETDPIVMKYINRLADWLFIYARYANHLSGVGDVLWSK